MTRVRSPVMDILSGRRFELKLRHTVCVTIYVRQPPLGVCGEQLGRDEILLATH
jgi:hypothetical protein